MLLTRLYLRNFRVYEEPLDLEMPPGLVGIYGLNGAGKCTLLEAIVFTLWGKARTAKDDVRTAGVGGDCITEVEFEHEGHLYLVRRTLSGINATAKAEAHCDGLVMSEGVRDTSRYVHQVLGMDDAAFRASVFAEQKQLAAFSSQSPAERRRLVLRLLGITPLDAARDAARKDAREARERPRPAAGPAAGSGHFPRRGRRCGGQGRRPGDRRRRRGGGGRQSQGASGGGRVDLRGFGSSCARSTTAWSSRARRLAPSWTRPTLLVQQARRPSWSSSTWRPPSWPRPPPASRTGSGGG